MQQLFTRTAMSFNPNHYKNTWLLLLLLLMVLKSNAQKVAINDSIATITNNLNPAQTLQQLSIETIDFTLIQLFVNPGFLESYFLNVIFQEKMASRKNKKFLKGNLFLLFKNDECYSKTPTEN